MNEGSKEARKQGQKEGRHTVLNFRNFHRSFQNLRAVQSPQNVGGHSLGQAPNYRLSTICSPRFTDLLDRLSIQYVLVLTFLDARGRRFFTQQEVQLWRKA